MILMTIANVKDLLQKKNCQTKPLVIGLITVVNLLYKNFFCYKKNGVQLVELELLFK